MSLTAEIREKIRQRAKYACEFCGVTEESVGGALTVDHYRPKSKGGSDTLDNLLYCCVRCNQYKQDYWPLDSSDSVIWNPLAEKASTHFVEAEDGELFPLTDTGKFTIDRLRLNRPPLVAYRRNKLSREVRLRSLEQYRDLVKLLEQANHQLMIQVEEQQRLLQEQRSLIKRLLQQQN